MSNFRRKNPSRDLSANKVMARFDWGTHCAVLYLTTLKEESSINSEYYINLLDVFNNDLKKSRPHLATNKELFCQDDAGVTKYGAALVNLMECVSICFLRLGCSPALNSHWIPFFKLEEIFQQKEILLKW